MCYLCVKELRTKNNHVDPGNSKVPNGHLTLRQGPPTYVISSHKPLAKLLKTGFLVVFALRVASVLRLRWAKSRDSYRRIASESYRCDSKSLAFVGGHITHTEISPHRPCRDSNRAIGVHSFNVRSTWNCRMACES